MHFRWPDTLVPSPHPPDVSSPRALLNTSRCVRRRSCLLLGKTTDRQTTTDLHIAYSAFQCLPVLYQVCHFWYWYRYRNRYWFSISIGSIGIGGVGGIVLTLPVTDVVGRQSLRSATQQIMVVPRHRLSTVGHRAFAVQGPMVWNSLPDDLRAQQDWVL